MFDIFFQDFGPRINQCKGVMPWLDRGRKPRLPEASLKPRSD